MQQFCKKFVLINVQESTKGSSYQYDYHIKRKKNVSNAQLIEALSANNLAQKVTIIDELDTNSDIN